MPEGPNPEKDSKSKILQKFYSLFKLKSKNNLNNIKEHKLSDKDSDIVDKYQKLEASDIMIPRVDIVAINFESTLNEISKTFLQSRHTRMPVYKGALDNITGYINIKDIMPYLLDEQQKPKFNINDVVRKLLIISPSMKILDLLEKMRQSRTHIALVVDELGGADGLITIEDLVEQFIGKIDDEYDNDPEEEFKEIAKNKFEVSGRLEIEKFKQKLGIELSDEDQYETVGGLILSYLGRVPSKGEKFHHDSSELIFEIADCDDRRINKVYISYE